NQVLHLKKSSVKSVDLKLIFSSITCSKQIFVYLLVTPKPQWVSRKLGVISNLSLHIKRFFFSKYCVVSFGLFFQMLTLNKSMNYGACIGRLLKSGVSPLIPNTVSLFEFHKAGVPSYLSNLWIASSSLNH
ncbi:hypothetical protein BpHYR1_022758, partial [Brachionus plicatilis]